MGSPFEKDGEATQFCEKLPIIGYGVAAVHTANGDIEQARRATARSTNGALSTVGAVGGFIAGGPPGAVAGAALGSMAGIGSEYHLSSSIKDANIKGDTGDLSVKRIISEVGLSTVGGALGGTGGAVSSAVGSISGRQVSSLMSRYVDPLNGIFNG